MTPKKQRSKWMLPLLGIASAILVVGLVRLQPTGSLLNQLARAAGLLGYLAIFLSILSSAFLRQLVKRLGQPFIRTHHRLSVAGLILIGLHPLSIIIDWGTSSVLLPKFDSVLSFLRWGGPPALYLLILASLAALFRTTFKKSWRIIHILNYVAFLLGTVHAILLGTDLSGNAALQIVVKAIAILMALAVVAVFIKKR